MQAGLVCCSFATIVPLLVKEIPELKELCKSIRACSAALQAPNSSLL